MSVEAVASDLLDLLDPFEGISREEAEARVRVIADAYRERVAGEGASKTVGRERDLLNAIATAARSLAGLLEQVDPILTDAFCGQTYGPLRARTRAKLEETLRRASAPDDLATSTDEISGRVAEVTAMVSGQPSDLHVIKPFVRQAAELLAAELPRLYRSPVGWARRLEGLADVAVLARDLAPRATPGGGRSASRHARTFGAAKRHLAREARALFERARPGAASTTERGPLHELTERLLAFAERKPFNSRTTSMLRALK